MLRLQSVFGSIILCFNFMLSLDSFGQDLVYPEEVETHYKSLLTAGPSNSVIQEWWREKGVEKVNKGASFRYDGKGRLSEIMTDDQVKWTYTYRNDGRPKLIVIASDSSVDTIFYQYQKEFCARLDGASHVADASACQYYYYDEQGRIIEEKLYTINTDEKDFAVSTLATRLVRTFMGPKDDRAKGEMFYNHVFLPTDGKVYQHKIVYNYYPDHKKLGEVRSYVEKAMTQKRPIPSEQFTEIQWLETSEYDTSGQLLIRQIHRRAINEPPTSERTYTYNDLGQLQEINFTGYFADRSAATKQRQVFENGTLKSYYYDGIARGFAYQASFVITPL